MISEQNQVKSDQVAKKSVAELQSNRISVPLLQVVRQQRSLALHQLLWGQMIWMDRKLHYTTDRRDPQGTVWDFCTILLNKVVAARYRVYRCPYKINPHLIKILKERWWIVMQDLISTYSIRGIPFTPVRVIILPIPSASPAQTVSKLTFCGLNDIKVRVLPNGVPKSFRIFMTRNCKKPRDSWECNVYISITHTDRTERSSTRWNELVDHQSIPEVGPWGSSR